MDRSDEIRRRLGAKIAELEKLRELYGPAPRAGKFTVQGRKDIYNRIKRLNREIQKLGREKESTEKAEYQRAREAIEDKDVKYERELKRWQKDQQEFDRSSAPAITQTPTGRQPTRQAQRSALEQWRRNRKARKFKEGRQIERNQVSVSGPTRYYRAGGAVRRTGVGLRNFFTADVPKIFPRVLMILVIILILLFLYRFFGFIGLNLVWVGIGVLVIILLLILLPIFTELRQNGRREAGVRDTITLPGDVSGAVALAVIFGLIGFIIGALLPWP